MLQMNPRDRMIVALDLPTVPEAEAMVDRLGAAATFYKVGMQLQFAGGLEFAERLARSGKDVFLDVKLLDIGNTIEGAVKNIARMGMRFVTIHAYPQAMRAAVAARGSADLGLLGVTVLTSMDDGDLIDAGYSGTVRDLVLARAADAKEAGMTGVIASPVEAAAIRKIVGPDFLIVTPGVRPSGEAAGDQKRVMTPAEAIRAGADHLVIGRPVTSARDPRAAAEAIVDEIGSAERAAV
jgi:orotidine-5'-phosphate decarboxylase